MKVLARWTSVDPDNPDRWWTQLVFWHVVAVLVWIGAGLVLTGDIDHRTTRLPMPRHPGETPPAALSSLGILHHVPLIRLIPWPAIGVLWILFALAILHPRTRAVGYFLGGLASVGIVVALTIYVYTSGNTTNPIVVPLSTLGPDAMFAGFRYARLPTLAAVPRRKARDAC